MDEIFNDALLSRGDGLYLSGNKPLPSSGVGYCGIRRRSAKGGSADRGRNSSSFTTERTHDQKEFLCHCCGKLALEEFYTSVVNGETKKFRMIRCTKKRWIEPLRCEPLIEEIEDDCIGKQQLD